jgi:hypothetical protein
MSSGMAWGLGPSRLHVQIGLVRKAWQRLSRYGLCSSACPRRGRRQPGRSARPSAGHDRVTVLGEEGTYAAGIRHGGTVMRVDGDVVEIFGAVGFSHRYLLPSLRVEVQPSSKSTLVVRSASVTADWPLYELCAKARYQRGEVEAFIPIADKPLYRQVFTQVAQLCGPLRGGLTRFRRICALACHRSGSRYPISADTHGRRRTPSGPTGRARRRLRHPYLRRHYGVG